MTQLEKVLRKLTGLTIKEISRTDTGERKFLIVEENRVLTHSELNQRFSL